MSDTEDEWDSGRDKSRPQSERSEIKFTANDRDDYVSTEAPDQSTKGGVTSLPHHRQSSPPRRHRHYDIRPPSDRHSGGRFSGGYRSFNNKRSRDIDHHRLMGFKEFVSLQDDRITASEASLKYEQYVQEFESRQFPLAFEKYKLQGWFMNKFHPYFMTMERIREVRFRKRRFNCFTTLLKHGIRVSFDAGCQKLLPVLKLVNMMLDHADDETIALCMEKLKQFESASTIDISDRLDSSDPSKPRDLTSVRDECIIGDIYKPNMAVEIQSIPMTVDSNKFVAELKRTRGFLRAAIVVPVDYNSATHKLISSFKAGSDFDDIKDSLSDVHVENYYPECVISNQTTPLIKVVKGPLDILSVAVAHCNVMVSLIEHLDVASYIYSKRFPEIPSYDPQFKTWDIKSDDFVPENSYVASDDEEGSSFDEAPEGVIINPIVTEAKEFLKTVHSITEITPAPRELLELVDRLALYLRIVHSFDFYSFAYIPFEHDYPCRCRLVHVRRSAGTTKVNQTSINQVIGEANRRLSDFIRYLNRFSKANDWPTTLKSPDTEADAFFETRIKEIRPGIWMCYLCKKKFQSREFVLKHFTNKHGSFLDAVRANAIFFNNFIIDMEFGGNKFQERVAASLDKTQEASVGTIEDISMDNFHIGPTKRKRLLEYGSLAEPDLNDFDF
ncbi:Serrate RNA effector molecule [Thelohanellus kitauei]|uniref:Serrate RNA effector molecule n=1 Tax=Thelohanellus kitauei TaxID=669202 RepID=A0A0C2MSF9_THEKT|nr:Serrate RNA effector molecule [Thelohanellus kitauei]